MIVIVIGARLVRIVHDLFDVLFRNIVFFHRAFDFVFFFRVDEDIGRARDSPQHVIGAPPYDYAGTLIRDFADCIELGQEKALIQRKAVRTGISGSESRRQAVQKTVFSLHLRFLHHFSGKTAFIRDSG